MRSKVALFSVFNKDEIFLNFAKKLFETKQWALLGSKGTSDYLNKNGVGCVDVADIIGEPILGHRVVTLSREIHAGLLATDSAEDRAELERLEILPIDLVYVDLYPLEEAIKSTEGLSPQESIKRVIEQTDIGGPAILRSAAKGRRIVLSSKSQLSDFLSREKDLKWLYEIESRPDYEDWIGSLAGAAEKVVAHYAKISGDFHENMSSYLAYARNKK